MSKTRETAGSIRETERLERKFDRERQVRAASVCPGCGGKKDPGCVVCWRCFKYREDVTPFKYADGVDLEEWLEQIGRPTLEEQGIVS